jgi:hypothetical protein
MARRRRHLAHVVQPREEFAHLPRATGRETVEVLAGTTDARAAPSGNPLLVIPGVGLLFDSWLGFALGLVLYVASRRFAPSEEREMAERFPDEYPAYRKRVLLPWL